MMSTTKSREEALRLAQRALGPVSDQELADFMEQRFGIRVRPQFVPLLKASLIEMERMGRCRSAAQKFEPAPSPMEPVRPEAR